MNLKWILCLCMFMCLSIEMGLLWHLCGHERPLFGLWISTLPCFNRVSGLPLALKYQLALRCPMSLLSLPPTSVLEGRDYMLCQHSCLYVVLGVFTLSLCKGFAYLSFSPTFIEYILFDTVFSKCIYLFEVLAIVPKASFILGKCSLIELNI